jgi:hypothetical protein
MEGPHEGGADEHAGANALRGALKGAFLGVALVGTLDVLSGVAPHTRGGVLRRIKQCFGVLALMALTAASVGVGPASAATRQNGRTKAQWQAAMAQVREPGRGCYDASYPTLRWHAVKCAVAPKVPLAPAGAAPHGGPVTIGNGKDYSAQVTGLISKATGTFHDVSSGITEKGKIDNTGSKIANAFSLQLNTQFFSGSPACSGSGTPTQCQAWQQFVYAYLSGTGYLFMQYWLINYNASCPAGWNSFSNDCYTNSNATTFTHLTAKELSSTKLSGSAASGGNDTVSLSVGSGSAHSVSNSDSEIDLAAAWNTTEWGVFGDAGGGEAFFGANTTLQAQTALTATSHSAPKCVKEGFTGETNNLTRTKTPALGSESSPTMASRQTNGTLGTASCAVKS